MEKHTLTNEQTDRQTNKQTDSQMQLQTNEQMDKLIHKQKDKRNKGTNEQTNRQTGSQTIDRTNVYMFNSRSADLQQSKNEFPKREFIRLIMNGVAFNKTGRKVREKTKSDILQMDR
jgi:hypothetical protein